MLPRASRLETPRNVPSHCFADTDVLTETILYVLGVSSPAHRQVQQPLVNKAGDCPRQVTGNKYPELRGGEEKVFFLFFVSNSQQPPGVSAIKRLADRTTVKSEEVEKFSRNHFVSCICSAAWHTTMRSPALTVFVKKKFNYIKVIEKLPVYKC